MKRIAIVGGGISGLTAAFYLEQARRDGAPVEPVLFEASNRLGGVIRTDHVDDYVIEAGPDSFLSMKPWAAQLARDAGIADQLLPSNDRKRRIYILHQGRLVTLPEGMQMMVPTQIWPVMKTQLLSFSTKVKMLTEFLAPPEPLAADQDESVASFIRRHFGDEVVKKLADPFLAGIYGGDSESLSARAALPRLMSMEREHHSLVRGTLRSLSEREGREQDPLFTSFRGGMQQLVDAVAKRLELQRVRTNAPVTVVMKASEGWSIPVAGGTEHFDQVLIATPSYVAAKLLPFDAELAELLGSIRYSDSATVAVAYSCEKLRRCTALPSGFGFLVPSGEGKKIIACTFVHNKFDSRVGDDFVLLRAFLTSGLEKTDAQLCALVESELASILNIKAPTECGRVYRWPRAMPQYEVGHGDKVAKISAAVGAHPGLQLIGNAYRGLGVPDCVREAKLAAERALAN